MKGSVEDSWILIVKFPYSTPVVGVELIPYFHVTKPNIEAPEYTLKYNWYRLESNESNESNEELLACSVHPTSLAKFQCRLCVMLKIRVEDCCHCSERCFRDSWPDHRARHNDAWGRLGGCGSWSSDDIYPYFLEKTATVVERDGISWLEVGCSETYVPAAIDVGYILKLECAVVDSVTGNPLAPTNITLTDRVIFPPLPYLRHMIQIGSETQPARSRTFNVLTYNVLSDHYARLGAPRYHYCPKWALTWQYRRQNLLREIIRYDADIICLQEVSRYKVIILRTSSHPSWEDMDTQLFTRRKSIRYLLLENIYMMLENIYMMVVQYFSIRIGLKKSRNMRLNFSKLQNYVLMHFHRIRGKMVLDV